MSEPCPMSCKCLCRKAINPNSSRKCRIKYACQISKTDCVKLSLNEGDLPVKHADCPKGATTKP